MTDLAEQRFADSQSAFFSANEFETLVPDISEFQPYANMKGIGRKNHGAVIIRMHNGSRADYSGARHRANAHRYNFKAIGLYQYLRHDIDPIRQASQFLRTVGNLEKHEFLVLDYEEAAPGSQLKRADMWRGMVRSRWPNVVIVLYSYLDFIRTEGLQPLFTKRTGWVADYSAVEPDVPHFLWQCTDGVDGINMINWPGAGYCDTSLYRGTIDELSQLVSGQHPKPPPPPPPADKDFLDMAEFRSLSRSPGAPHIELAPGKWVPLKFDTQSGNPDRKDWREIIVAPALVSGSVTITLDAVVSDFQVKLIELDGSKVHDLTPAMSVFVDETGVFPVNTEIMHGTLLVLVRSHTPAPVHVTGCTFTGFIAK